MIAVWKFGSYGHVGFVEEISSDKSKYRLSDFNRSNKEMFLGMLRLEVIKDLLSIGIGTKYPYYKLHVYGNAFTTGTWGSSDKRYKKNILPIQNSLEKISLLQGVNYQWRTEQ